MGASTVDPAILAKIDTEGLDLTEYPAEDLPHQGEAEHENLGE